MTTPSHGNIWNVGEDTTLKLEMGVFQWSVVGDFKNLENWFGNVAVCAVVILQMSLWLLLLQKLVEEFSRRVQ
jgi:hypothetical protein